MDIRLILCLPGIYMLLFYHSLDSLRIAHFRWKFVSYVTVIVLVITSMNLSCCGQSSSIGQLGKDCSFFDVTNVFLNELNVGEKTEEHDLLKKPFVFVEGGVLSNRHNKAVFVLSFHISSHEITCSEWRGVFAQRVKYGYFFDNDGVGSSANHPVVNVNWYDCVKWCNLASEIKGIRPVYFANSVVYKHGRSDNVVVDRDAYGFRLPTDVEWEYAAKGGVYSKGFVYSGGNDLGDVGWYRENSIGADVNMEGGRGTWTVGQKIANEIGIYDMSGNVWEWCFDWHPDFVGLLRVRRGGSWKYFSSYCRTAFRYSNGPKFARSTIGFRVVLSHFSRDTGCRKGIGVGSKNSSASKSDE